MEGSHRKSKRKGVKQAIPLLKPKKRGGGQTTNPRTPGLETKQKENIKTGNPTKTTSPHAPRVRFLVVCTKRAQRKEKRGGKMAKSTKREPRNTPRRSRLIGALHQPSPIMGQNSSPGRVMPKRKKKRPGGTKRITAGGKKKNDPYPVEERTRNN